MSMNAAQQTMHFENVVRQEWTNTVTVNAWDRWSAQQAVHCQPLTDRLIEHAQLRNGLKVLDLACGVGEPSLSIARRVGPSGSVIATDLSEGMLGVAAKNAADAGLSNIVFKTADAHQLPFADRAFDRVVSRLGLMYFWNIEKAIAEIHRVLKPGGVASFVVWGAAENNEYFGTILAPFMQRREMPTPPDDAPTPTRFGDTAKLIALFRQAGFSEVHSQEYREVLPWPGTPRELYSHFYDVAAPLQPYIDSFDVQVQAEVLDEIEQAFGRCWDGTHTNAAASFNAIYLKK